MPLIFVTSRFISDFLHPSGVDFLGYTVEKKITTDVYSFYSFGVPSIAAIGFSYYTQYNGNGLTSSIGVGIGSVLYGSVAYQIHLKKRHCLKIGAGLTTSIVYNGTHPVIAYEHRF